LFNTAWSSSSLTAVNSWSSGFRNETQSRTVGGLCTGVHNSAAFFFRDGVIVDEEWKFSEISDDLEEEEEDAISDPNVIDVAVDVDDVDEVAVDDVEGNVDIDVDVDVDEL
jgi:hypothetical protein